MGAATDVLPLISVIAAGAAFLLRPAPPGTGSSPAVETSKIDVDSLLRLSQLHAEGNLSEFEFASGKAKVFGHETAAPVAGDATTHTWEQVAEHSTDADCWAVVINEVYDFSCFFAAEPCYDHPGGMAAISKFCGGDATAGFVQAGHKPGIAKRKGVGQIVIGTVPPAAAPAGQSAAVTVDPFNLEPWRCQEDECKWIGYHIDPRSWQKAIGTHSWFFIHSVAAKYPEHPSAEDQRHMINFIAFLGQHYPCKVCRLNLQQELRYPEVAGGEGEYYGVKEAVMSRQKLALWLCRLHNIVNRDTGKEEVECTNIAMDMQYLKNCGECSVKKDEAGNDDHGGHTSYVWDADLYATGSLHAVKSATDQFGATELEEALGLAVALHYETPASADAVRAAILAGEQTHDSAIEALEAKMGEALALKDANKKKMSAATSATKKEAAAAAAAAKPAAGGGDDDDWDM